MKIGIYLGYSPCGKDFSLKKEGLGRYLSYLIKGFTKNSNEVVIACPRWLIDSIDELIEEQNIPHEQVKFLVPSDMPFIYKIYLRYLDKEIKTKSKRLQKIQLVTYQLIDQIVEIMINAKNFVSFGMVAVFFLLLGIVSIPFLVLFLTFYLIKRIFKELIYLLVGERGKRSEVKRSIKSIILKNRLVRRYANKMSPLFDISRIKERMRINSANEIVRLINRMSDPMDLWYCPMAFWEEFSQINGTKVTCAPDLVTAEMPINFSVLDCTTQTDDVKNTINKGTYFITYCEYLKRSLLVNKFNKSIDNIISIPHANNDMLEFVNVKKYFNGMSLSEDANSLFCRKEVFPSLRNNAIGVKEYFDTEGPGSYAFEDMKYIFYSSQVRPNKNIITLIKAYEYILREKNIPIKLILTGNIKHNASVKSYIYENRLQYDVLSFFNVTNQQLAALYMQAELVVNPTLYEGGFPFTFGEGMSVGTPSVMSNIPQVMEVVSGYDLDDCIFDPYSYKDLANKIIYGLEYKDYIYKKQKVLYDILAERKWEDVCKDYEDAFKYFITKESDKICGS